MEVPFSRTPDLHVGAEMKACQETLLQRGHPDGRHAQSHGAIDQEACSRCRCRKFLAYEQATLVVLQELSPPASDQYCDETSANLPANTGIQSERMIDGPQSRQDHGRASW